jgi:glycosyltransferase involved in cell wall biosynthesis
MTAVPPEFCILYFGNDWNAENRTSSHHIAQRLGARFPLLYIDTPGLRAPQATGRDFRKLFGKLSNVLELPRPIGPHMWVMTMPQIPFRKLPGTAAVNRAASAAMVRRAARHLGFRNPVYWFVVPHASVVLGRRREEFVVYYCIDDFAAFPGVDAPSIQRMDDELSIRADQLFVASARLMPEKKKLNASATLSPHGVDVDLFAKAMDPTTGVPEPARALRKPVIGYFGVLGDWIDIELLEYCAQKRPDWSFLFIGRISTEVSNLRRLPNTVFIPPQPYASLPEWAKAFDVAVIPYRLTRQVLNSNPLKLREYLATGKPIVAVRAPEIEKFGHVLPLADNHEEFLAHLDNAVHDRSAASRQSRLDSIRGQSWDDRVDAVVEIVRQKRKETESRSIR